MRKTAKKNKKTYDREFKIEAIKLFHTSNKMWKLSQGIWGSVKAFTSLASEFRADPDQA